MRRFFKYWLPLLIWVCVIFLGSTDMLSAEHTSRFMVPFLLWLKPGMSPDRILFIHIVMRKSAHVSEYAILAILLWRALRSNPTLRTNRPMLLGAVLFASAVFALLIVAIFADRHSKRIRSTAHSQFVDARL